MAPKPLVRRSTQTKPTQAGAAGSVKMSKSQIVLLVLSIEKFIQHMFVTYAFAVDMGGIRDSVVIHHAPLMIVVSIIVATIILVILFRNRKTLLQS